jgi:hypothetical protein
VQIVNELHNPKHFSKPKKVTVEYDNAFDLMTQCMGEGAGWWETVITHDEVIAKFNANHA